MRTVTGDYSKDISINRMKLDEECEFHVALLILLQKSMPMQRQKRTQRKIG